MSGAGLLLALDLVLGLVGVALWVITATRAGRALLVGALVAGSVTTLRLVVVGLLWTHAWEFVQEKVLLGLPLALAPAAVALGLVVRDRRGRVSSSAATRTACWCAAWGGIGSLAASYLVGYPLGVTEGIVVVLVTAAAGGVTWLIITGGSRPMIAGVVAGTAVLMTVVTGTAWWADLPSTASGDHTHHGHDHGHSREPGLLVSDLRTPPAGAATTRRVELVARTQDVRLPSGRTVAAWTFGSVPGPTITAHQGETLEVTLRNADVASGVTLHWHGYDVPNGEDGVAGVTQDAVRPGESFRYRFRADQVGTYWYHTHQRAREGIRKGLSGALVVLPATGRAADVDITLPFSLLESTPVLAGSDELVRRSAEPGSRVRLRLVNTDQLPRRFGLVGVPFRVAAIDGTEVREPSDVVDRALRVPAGGRYDVAFTMPARPVRLSIDGARSTGLLLAVPAGAADPPHEVPAQDLDPLSYGAPRAHQGGSGPYDVEASMVLDRLPRFHGGVPTYAQTINGRVFPHVPAIVVEDGDLVRLRVVNRGFETHPMHPHGHHVLVLAVNGRAPTGSPLWLDTFDVRPGEVWDVALRADNPGVWMSHCHNLEHAEQGMVMHLTYRGVSSPFVHGRGSGNQPE